MAEDLLDSAIRILVVDDEPGMRQGCKRALTPAGYVVETAADLSEGVSLLESQPFDLFLLDVMLPDGSGLNLIDPILQQDPFAICIIITGAGSIEMAVEAVRRGAYDLVTKPFTSDELLLAVSQGVERRRLATIEVRAQELAQAKEELERLDKVKSQLMLKMAHEMRAPVAAAQGYVHLLLGGYMEEDEIESSLVRVQDRLQETLDLVADLLELAHLKQPQEAFGHSAKTVDMAGCLEDVIDMVRDQALAKKQDLQVEITDRPRILADRDYMKQIWTNLLTNAIKYTPEGGRVTVLLKCDNTRLEGVVKDTGMGVGREDLDHLFQDFFRTEQAKASGEIGTGIGLSIVKQIVDGYHGEIDVSSELGQGTTFRFTLPLEPAVAEPMAPATGGLSP